LAYIERTARRRGSAMVQFLCLRLNPTDRPDIITLPLTPDIIMLLLHCRK
jgi:hypothetical protein